MILAELHWAKESSEYEAWRLKSSRRLAKKKLNAFLWFKSYVTEYGEPNYCGLNTSFIAFEIYRQTNHFASGK